MDVDASASTGLEPGWADTDPEVDDESHEQRLTGRHGRAAIVLVATFVIGLGVRLWLVSSRVPSWWQDSDDYMTASRHGLASLDFWAGERSPAAPLVLKLTGGDDGRYMYAQLVIGALCWALLAMEVTRSTLDERGASRWAVAGAVVALSIGEPLTMWERSVLSESLATSALALVLATTLWMVRQPTWPAAATLSGTVAAFVITRDTNAALVLLTASGLGFAAVWEARRQRLPRSPVLVVLGALIVIACLAIMASEHGNRSDLPTRNLYQARVLPYPDRVEWFVDHGMPQGPRFLGPDRIMPHLADGLPPVTYIADDDPSFGAWLRWVEADGQRMYVTWLATHPSHILTEPLHEPERAFNNAEGDRSFYAAVDQRSVPLVSEVFFPSRPLAIVVCTVAIGCWLANDRRCAPLVWVGLACVALALPHAALSWHADAMETARHLMVPVVQLHVGTLLLCIGVATQGSAPARDGAIRIPGQDSEANP